MQTGSFYNNDETIGIQVMQTRYKVRNCLPLITAVLAMAIQGCGKIPECADTETKQLASDVFWKTFIGSKTDPQFVAPGLQALVQTLNEQDIKGLVELKIDNAEEIAIDKNTGSRTCQADFRISIKPKTLDQLKSSAADSEKFLQAVQIGILLYQYIPQAKQAYGSVTPEAIDEQRKKLVLSTTAQAYANMINGRPVVSERAETLKTDGTMLRNNIYLTDDEKQILVFDLLRAHERNEIGLFSKSLNDARGIVGAVRSFTATEGVYSKTVGFSSEKRKLDGENRHVVSLSKFDNDLITMPFAVHAISSVWEIGNKRISEYKPSNTKATNEPAEQQENPVTPPVQPAQAAPETSQAADKIGPSFDCSKAGTSSEQMICSNKELAEADLKLSNIYRGAMERSANRDELKKTQNEWRKSVRDKCSDVQCMLNAYKNRTTELSN